MLKKISDLVYYCEETSTVVAQWTPGHATQAHRLLLKNSISAKRLILMDAQEGIILNPMARNSDPQFGPLEVSPIRHKFEHIYYVNGNARLKECYDYITDNYPKHKMKMLCSTEFELLYRTQRSLDHGDLVDAHREYEAKYHFISLNGVPKWDRAYVLSKVLNEDTINKICYSWIKRNLPNHQLDNWKTPYFNPTNVKLLDATQDNIARRQEMLPSEYHESAIDTFVESGARDEVGLFVTEKTWKPLMMGKVFWGLNSPGYWAYLESLGIRLYPNIFDYSLDSIVDSDKRMDAHCDEMKRILDIPLSDLEKLIESHRDDIEYNKQLIRNFPKQEYTELRPYAKGMHLYGLR